MAQANDTQGLLHQNLMDAGCDENTAERCMELFGDGKPDDMLLLLSKYKTALLSQVCTGQKQIDCLDFLIYKLQNRRTSE